MAPPEQAKAIWKRARTRVRRLRKKYGPEVLYSYRFSRADADVTAAAWPGMELRELTPELLSQMADRYEREFTERKRTILEGRIGHPTQTCWVIVTADGTPAGYCHVSWSDTVNERINHRVRVGPEQAYFYDVVVFREHRRQGLHTFSIARRLELAAERGVSEGITTITSSNIPSRASFGKFGATVTHRLVHIPPLHRTFQLPIRSQPAR